MRIHWDREPLIIARQRESADKSDALQTLRAVWRPRQSRSVWSACVFSAAFPMQTAGSWPVLFMENPFALAAVTWDLEPLRIPLNRPPGTFSPVGEKDGMRGTVHGKVVRWNWRESHRAIRGWAKAAPSPWGEGGVREVVKHSSTQSAKTPRCRENSDT